MGCAAALLCAPAASATTINVETFTESGTMDSMCSLREAVTSANNGFDSDGDCEAGDLNAGSTDTIVLQAGTYELGGVAADDANASGDLDLLNESGGIQHVVFDGVSDNPMTGTVIDANDLDRAIDRRPDTVGSPTNRTTVEDLLIRDGNAGATGDGGAIRVINGNDFLDVRRSTVESSHAGDNGGAIYYAVGGGGSQHPMQVFDSEFVLNDADNEGGAIWVDQSIGPLPTGSNSYEFVRSTFTQNDSVNAGGALYLEAAPRFDLLNSTLTQNTAGGGGGAVASGSSNAELHVQYSTVAGNSTTLASTMGAGGIQTDLDNQRVYFEGSILSGNLANGVLQNCFEIDGASSDGLFQSKSFGYSLDTGNTCDLGDAEGGPGEPPDASNDPTGDVINAGDPFLGGLAENGGLTRTMALGTGSSARDKVPNSPDYCRIVDAIDEAGPPFDPPTIVNLNEDQRGPGFVRPDAASGLCDIGAFEVQTAAPPGTTPTTPVTPTIPTTPPKKCKKGRKLKKGKCVKKRKKKK